MNEVHICICMWTQSRFLNLFEWRQFLAAYAAQWLLKSLTHIHTHKQTKRHLALFGSIWNFMHVHASLHTLFGIWLVYILYMYNFCIFVVVISRVGSPNLQSRFYQNLENSKIGPWEPFFRGLPQPEFES